LVFFRLHIERCACHLYWQHVGIDSFFIFQKTVSYPSKLTLSAMPPLQHRPIALWSWGGFWCTLSGIASFISVSGGIPLQIFLLSCKVPRTVFIGSAGAFFFILNLTKVPLYWELDILSKSSLIISLLLLPAIPIGVILGRKISDLMTDQQFYLLLHFALGVVGLQLLVSVYA
jgi:uncharacterized membrane protein YfcA